MELDDRKIEQANTHAAEMQKAHPRAFAARYDRRLARVIISLNTRLEIGFAPQDAEGLEHAKPAELEPIEISPSGLGIYFPKLDADLYLPALLEGFLGSKKWMTAKWMAAQMGAEGGRVRSKAKTAAARANGALGGRPKSKKKATSKAKPASKVAALHS
jgi:hypothetical protein